MRVSQLITKTRKEAPADETARNAQLLIRAGFVNKEMAGVYSFLPLGLRTLNKISQIIREEMDAVGGQELLMPSLQIPERYEATGRWDDDAVDVWFKTKLANGSVLGLGFSHEENLVPIVKNYLNSYKELPFTMYQIQWKFRNELRSKSGIMRGREFLMKDMYSFSLTQEQHDETYEKIKQAYVKVYDRLGIGENTYYAFASGGSFSKYSHEFQTLSDVGEDTIFINREKKVAINEEVLEDDILAQLGISRDELEEVRAIEVGNIFGLGTKFSAPFDLSVTDESGNKVTVIMGCYGIGVTRVMGTIAELTGDDRGLVWPKSIAPFQVHIVVLGKEQEILDKAEQLYKQLRTSGLEALYDDRDISAGEKFADADLMGMPYRVTIGKKSLESESYEVRDRKTGETTNLTLEELKKTIGIN
jgi:prolyl-tRNA synthetase